MTPQECYEYITNKIQGDGTHVTAQDDEALAFFQKYINLRIKKKPVTIGSPADYNTVCPRCHQTVEPWDNFCNNAYCGQALDWSKDN